MIKSASTFTYNCMKAAVNHHNQTNGYEELEPSQIAEDLKWNFVDRNTDIESFKNILKESYPEFLKDRHIVIKTHLDKRYFEQTFAKEEFCGVANFRHPAEIAISLRDAAIKDKALNKQRFDAFDTFESAIEQVPYQIECFNSWRDSLTIYYDDLVTEPQLVFQEIISKLTLISTSIDAVMNVVQGKEKIAEFNVAKQGRRFDELSKEQLNEIEHRFKEFVEFIEEYNKK